MHQTNHENVNNKLEEKKWIDVFKNTCIYELQASRCAMYNNTKINKNNNFIADINQIKMKQEINQYEERFLHAFRTSNVEIVDELLHDEMVYNNAAGEIVSKKADLEGFKSANPKIEIVDCLEREIQLFDETAVVSTVIYLKGVFGGNQIEGKIRFLRIWKRFQNNWKIIGVTSVNLND